MIHEMLLLKRYQFLLQQLVKRDFKTKYRGSMLGVIWSVLNPLLNMLVLSTVFSHVFHQVENYRLYILSGITIFTYFSEATQLGLMSVVNNFNLFGKVKIPRTVFPVSKVFSSAISFIITIFVFLALSWFSGLKPTIYYLFIPIVVAIIIIFVTGMTFLLSTLEVFFRDTQHLYSVICTILMYATPILYPFEETIPVTLQPIFRLNPMYYYVLLFRNVTFYGQMPALSTVLCATGFAFGTFLLGLFVFCRKQDDFIYYT